MAAKKAAKAPAKAKKGRAAKTPPAMVKKFDAAFEQWKDGVQIAVLADKLGVRRGALRRQLRRRAGGKAQFKALRNQGAGGIRASLGERAAKESLDAKAQTIPVGGRKAWTHRYVSTPDGMKPVHVVGKTGIELIACEGKEAADFLAEMGNGLPPARLKYHFRPEGKTLKF